eukprot:642858-Prymnesium_polylepis.1
MSSSTRGRRNVCRPARAADAMTYVCRPAPARPMRDGDALTYAVCDRVADAVGRLACCCESV